MGREEVAGAEALARARSHDYESSDTGACSIKARLLNEARKRGERFERTLARFAAERLLLRLGASAAKERCVVVRLAVLDKVCEALAVERASALERPSGGSRVVSLEAPC